MEITFAAGDAPVTARLREVTDTTLVIETDVETAERGLFHDTPERRLEAFDGGFNRDLPVLIELEPRGERPEPWPPSSTDEADWNAREVWQEHELPAALGGGAIKAGYRTVFSAPRNEIDALKRRGPVTRTVVEALIENGIPVRFEHGAFEFGLGVGDQEYGCWIRPNEQVVGFELTVLARGASGDPDTPVGVGRLEATEDGLRYVHEIRVAPELVSEAWVIATIRAGVSVLHAVTSG
jgi:hypothetical protein